MKFLLNWTLQKIANEMRPQNFINDLRQKSDQIKNKADNLQNHQQSIFCRNHKNEK
jgi:hypothetical protein